MDQANRGPRVEDSYWRWLLHRWLVQYNPLYLLSAMLVLGGMILTSRGLAREGSLYGEIGVAAVAELYAATLIGGAALLVRIGLRRPAVMLALLTVLYQCDLTLHTETCAFLGAVGAWATAGWLLLFIVKLRALAWAMRLRLSRTAIVTAGLGAFGLAVLPHHLQGLDTRAASAIVAAWLFALFTSFASAGARGITSQGDTADGITSVEPLDAWGQTVLRRAVGASWLLSAVLLVGHVMFWSTQRSLSLAALLPVVPLLLVRRARSETRAFALAGVTVLAVAVAVPAAFAMTALLAAAALALRALPGTRVASARAASTTREANDQPYRVPEGDPAPAAALRPPVDVLVPVPHAERMRLLVGALFATYLAAWTTGWSGGPWPAHVMALDLALTALVVLAVWRARVRSALLPFAATLAHLVVQKHLVPAPHSLLEWGAITVFLGFVLLLASLAASYQLRRTGPEA